MKFRTSKLCFFSRQPGNCLNLARFPVADGFGCPTIAAVKECSRIFGTLTARIFMLLARKTTPRFGQSRPPNLNAA